MYLGTGHRSVWVEVGHAANSEAGASNTYVQQMT